jgi:hypothetical protein
MKCKADEFHELQQGNKSVEEYTYQFIELARYAPEEVKKDEKSRICSKRVWMQNLRSCFPHASTQTSTH